MSTPVPSRRIILTLPSRPEIGQVVLSGFNGKDSVVQKAIVNLKRSGGYTPGGGLKLNRLGVFGSKAIWKVTSVVMDEATAVRYRELILIQQDLPYLGQIVLTDQDSIVNARETTLGTRSIVPDSTVTVGGVGRSEIAARVFLETAGDADDIIRPVGRGGWAIDFTATEI
jgi:hypothetical protein